MKTNNTIIQCLDRGMQVDPQAKDRAISNLVMRSANAEHAVETWHDAECVECSKLIRTRFGVGMCKECAAPYNAAYGDENDSPASAVRAIKQSRANNMAIHI